MVDTITVAYGDIALEDADAIYVWAGTGSVSFGSLRGFQAAAKSKTVFAEEDWLTATGAAQRFSKQSDIETIYVVRNA